MLVVEERELDQIPEPNAIGWQPTSSAGSRDSAS
jgi:hypothetical protein